MISPWGVTLTHADTDVLPMCSAEFGAIVARPTRPYGEFWVKVDFELAAFAAAKPRRDDEDTFDVSGYDLAAKRRNGGDAGMEQEEAEWLRTGLCPDPRFYFSTDSTWLDAERRSWAQRQRTRRRPEEAVHFLLDGRDGYVEILAAGFRWRAWPRAAPVMSTVTDSLEPVMVGEWTVGNGARG